MSFTASLSQPDLGVRFFATVQGIPDVYFDGEIPLGPTGVAWANATSKGYEGTNRAGMLDLSQGLRAQAVELSGRSGATVPTSLTLRLRDDRSGYLRRLFARDVAGIQTAQLTATLDYDTLGAGAEIQVDSTSGWNNDGLAYLGRETIYYAATTATTLDARDSAGGARDLFSVGYCDVRYDFDADSPSGPRLITTAPTIWHGRYVQVFAYIVDQYGYALDSGFGGNYQREIWRGVIQGLPRPEESWSVWALETKSIDSLLRTKVGGTAPRGLLHRVPGGVEAQQTGIPDNDTLQPGGEPRTFVITDSTRFVYLTVTGWATRADMLSDTSPTVTDYALEVYGTGATPSDSSLCDQVTGTIAAAIAADLPGVVIRLSSDAQGFRLYHYTPTVADGADYGAIRIQWHFDADGSLLRLCGFGGDVGVDLFTNVANPRSAEVLRPGGDVLAGVIGVDALELVVFTGDIPAAPGYARIGDQECIRYETATAGTLAGTVLLGGLTRGALNTTAKPIVIERGTPGEEIEVRFGWGYDGVSLFEAALNLAQSTGSAYRGAYDYGDRAGTAISPAHFDLVTWTEASNELLGWEKRVSYFLSEEVDLAEVLDGWLAPLRCYVSSRATDSGFLIVVDRELPALRSESLLDIGTESLDARDPAAFASGFAEIINQLEVEYQWDNAAEDARDVTVTITDRDSVDDCGVRSPQSWTLRGYRWSPGEALAYVSQWAAQVAQRHGRPYDLLQLRVNRVGWTLKPGDSVTVTLPGAPAPDGSDGIVERLAVVVSVSQTYWDPGGAVGAEVTVALQRDLNQTTYSPSARVSSYVGTSLTLAAHEFTTSGGPVDASHFVAGDKVRIYEEGDPSSYEDRTVSSVTGNTMVVNTAPTLSTPLLLTAQPFTAATATQRLHAFIASSATPPLLGASDPAFRYV